MVIVGTMSGRMMIVGTGAEGSSSVVAVLRLTLWRLSPRYGRLFVFVSSSPRAVRGIGDEKHRHEAPCMWNYPDRPLSAGVLDRTRASKIRTASIPHLGQALVNLRIALAAPLIPRVMQDVVSADSTRLSAKQRIVLMSHCPVVT